LELEADIELRTALGNSNGLESIETRTGLSIVATSESTRIAQQLLCKAFCGGGIPTRQMQLVMNLEYVEYHISQGIFTRASDTIWT
jgi:hypothetical protein